MIRPPALESGMNIGGRRGGMPTVRSNEPIHFIYVVNILGERRPTSQFPFGSLTNLPAITLVTLVVAVNIILFHSS
jgi:hypothetical protein